MRARSVSGAVTLAAVLVLSACGGDSASAGGARRDSPPAAAAPSVSPPAARVSLGENAQPGGRVIEIRMVTDERGNRYEPDTVRARPRDVLRFVLVTGMHNVSFPADRNPGVRGLPAPSELLQAPGQSREYAVGLVPGAYYFQCDPHAALGMTGTLVVEQERT